MQAPAIATRIDIAATEAALRAAQRRATDLLSRVRSPDARAGRLEWTVAETSAHMVASVRLLTDIITGERDADAYLAAAAGARTPGQRNAVGNSMTLNEITERDPSRLATMLGDSVERFISAAKHADPGARFTTEAGVTMTAPIMLAAELGELLVHGFDVARGAALPWSVPRSEALLVIAGVLAVMPEYVDRQASAGKHISYELRFRGGPRYRVAIDDGSAEVSDAGQAVDCWISADPTAFLLVGYGRLGQWSQALRGRIIAGGRKPWLGLQFAGFLTDI